LGPGQTDQVIAPIQGRPDNDIALAERREGRSDHTPIHSRAVGPNQNGPGRPRGKVPRKGVLHARSETTPALGPELELARPVEPVAQHPLGTGRGEPDSRRVSRPGNRLNDLATHAPVNGDRSRRAHVRSQAALDLAGDGSASENAERAHR
jgi:hypothetical protein